jgi:hypothetical protein
MGHFYWPFIKNSNIYNAHPNRSFYNQYNIVYVFVFSSLVYNTRAHFWAKDMGQTLVHIFMHILNACAFIFNFVYHIFGLGFFNSLGLYFDIYID